MPDETDSPTALRAALWRTVRLVNVSSGRLPAEAVVAARRIADTLAEIIDTSDVRPLDVSVVISIRATVDDYLPTTLRSYLVLDPSLLALRRADGATPTESLLEQLTVLQDSTSAVLAAAHSQDLDMLVSQGNFLRTKFSRSDLDL
ncbi:MAG: hypothetical protein ACJ74U_07595 [Jatrophihabitantaceae bacterium]